MIILIDDVEVGLDDLGGDSSKAAVYDAVKKNVASKGLVVTSITVDGEEVQEEAFLAIAGGIEARFATQPIRQLVCDSLAEGEKYFKLLIPGLEAVAQLLESKQTSEALTRFSQAVEGIGWLINVFNNSCMLLGIQLDSLQSGNFEEDHSVFQKGLEELAPAMDAGKYLEVAYRIRENIVPAVSALSRYWSEVATLASSTVQ